MGVRGRGLAWRLLSILERIQTVLPVSVRLYQYRYVPYALRVCVRTKRAWGRQCESRRRCLTAVDLRNQRTMRALVLLTQALRFRLSVMRLLWRQAAADWFSCFGGAAPRSAAVRA